MTAELKFSQPKDCEPYLSQHGLPLHGLPQYYQAQSFSRDSFIVTHQLAGLASFSKVMCQCMRNW
ncbi:hypothetical protein SAMN05216255_2352 [Pseudomonas segetis]|uniref:Uncharacterized protein n=1 Tax=Pseudomonas segetis TaxID=298908 RepID=A0A239DPL3_9PSED|nr:hypothetical protein SAMN05216255_2352 [Pseudomonas segetis]